MNHVELTDAFLVGHPEIDSEHVEIVNQLNECLDLAASGGDADAVGDKIAEIIETLRRHVHHEEVIMARIGYEIAAEEERHHRAGLKALAELREQLSRSGDVAMATRKLKNLIMVTFLTTDMGLKSYMPEIRV